MDEVTRFRDLEVRIRTAKSISDPSYLVLFEEWAAAAPAEVRDDAALVARISIACLKGEHEIPPPEPEYHAAGRRIEACLERECALDPHVNHNATPEKQARAEARFAARGIKLRLRR